jgi:hypothetical protein
MLVSEGHQKSIEITARKFRPKRRKPIRGWWPRRFRSIKAFAFFRQQAT